MNWFALAMKALPFVFRLMGIAEKILSNTPKSGSQKKELVLEGTKAVIGAVAEMSTGGQKETMDKIMSVVDPAIDVAAPFLFTKD